MQMKDSSQVMAAYEQIQKMIMSYVMQPGLPISDHKLAKELNMSRAPIREAILLLQMDGLVQTNESGKMIVAPLRLEDIIDIMHVRSALESEALRIIADAGWLSTEQEAELMEIHEKMCGSDPSCIHDQYFYDDLFHQKLVDYSGSPRIIEVLGRMRLQMQRARWLNVVKPVRQAEASKEHGDLLSAILRHDKEEAVQLLRVHFENSVNSFRLILSDKQIQTFAATIRSFFT